MQRLIRVEVEMSTEVERPSMFGPPPCRRVSRVPISCEKGTLLRFERNVAVRTEGGIENREGETGPTLCMK